jgi:hypothetical protein
MPRSVLTMLCGVRKDIVANAALAGAAGLKPN